MSNMISYFQNNNKRARRAITWYIASSISAVVGITIVLLILFARLIFTALLGASADYNESTDYASLFGAGRLGIMLMLAIVFLAVVAAFVASYVVYLMWLHRAHQNAEAIAGEPLLVSASWNVGFHFIPVANFVMPLILLYQISKKSTEETLTLVKFYIGLMAASSLMSVITTIITALNSSSLAIYSAINSNDFSATNSLVSGFLSFISGIISFVSWPVSIATAILFVFMIDNINKQQQKMAEQNKIEIKA